MYCMKAACELSANLTFLEIRSPINRRVATVVGAVTFKLVPLEKGLGVLLTFRPGSGKREGKPGVCGGGEEDLGVMFSCVVEESDWTWFEEGGEIIPFLEYTPDNTRVRCNICRESRVSGLGNWVHTKNLKTHLKCATHSTCWQNYLDTQLREKEESAQLSLAYNASAISTPSISSSSLPSAPPAMFPAEPDDTDMDLDLPEWQPLPSVSQLIRELGAEPEYAPTPEETQRMLREQYEQILVNAYQESHLDQDGVEEQFMGADSPKIDAEGEEDDIEDDPMSSSEYFPYPSKPYFDIKDKRLPKSSPD
ncbi:hypothetical protein R3P38DRAFT_2803516 [Favolaschia claudopus]|uniref:BED-type domain-containing protein n=1 Tax=Favolaschia claudopus TaxID=2862362 RepID=A0AAV9ZTJ4_9AGAR